MESGISARLTPTEGRKFGLLVGGAFLVLGAVFWRRANIPVASVTLGLSTLLIAGGLVAPSRLGPIYRGWMALAHAISKVTTPVVMGVIFFAVITPAGLLVRWFGHRPLSRGPGGGTYWVSRPSGTGRSDMDHQF